MWITFGKRAQKSGFPVLPTVFHSDRHDKLLFINWKPSLGKPLKVGPQPAAQDL
jgi:hypothetical protein